METDYKNFAITLAKEAGKIIQANFCLGMKKEWKADHTPLTVTDTTINQIVIDAVHKQFPGHSILAEEGSSMIEGSEFVWVCDPVDGTVPFSHGVPTAVFSLALVKNGHPILGVIYDPFMDRMFYAQKGNGAFLNNQPIKVGSRSLEESIVGWETQTMSTVKNSYPQLKLMAMYAICYEGMLVACGEFAAAFYGHKAAHDIAALKIIVEEAGGKVTDRNGNEQRYDQPINGALISNGVIHEELLKFSKQK